MMLKTISDEISIGLKPSEYSWAKSLAAFCKSEVFIGSNFSLVKNENYDDNSFNFSYLYFKCEIRTYIIFLIYI